VKGRFNNNKCDETAACHFSIQSKCSELLASKRNIKVHENDKLSLAIICCSCYFWHQKDRHVFNGPFSRIKLVR